MGEGEGLDGALGSTSLTIPDPSFFGAEEGNTWMTEQEY